MSDSGNWVGNVVPGAGADVVFSGTARTSPHNDLAAASLHSIEFAGSGFSLDGNGLTVTGGITVDSVVTGSAVSLGVALGGTITVTVPGDALTLSGVTSGTGSLAKAGGGTLTVQQAGDYTWGGSMTGSGNFVFAPSAGFNVLRLTQPQSYGGSTTVGGGYVVLATTNTGSALPVGTHLTVSAGAFLDLSGNGKTVEVGGLEGGGTIYSWASSATLKINVPSGQDRTFNRDGQAFNVGETFAGLPFELGIELTDALKGLVPPGMTMAQFALRWCLDFEG
jgi:hypothetical protein